MNKAGEMKWRSITTIPKDELVLVGVWVQHCQQPEPHFEYYVAKWDFETNTMVDQAFETLPWEVPWDFDVWMPLPKPSKENTNDSTAEKFGENQKRDGGEEEE